MGNARSYTVDEFVTEKRFDLRDKLTNSRYETGELLVYLNRCYEMLHMLLVGMNSELAATGSGTITLADGTEAYALSSNSMGDFWAPFKLHTQNRQRQDVYAIYLTDSSSGVHDALPMIPYEERFEYLQGGTSAEAQPQGFYLFGDYIGFLPVPDTTYTCTIAKYFPNFVALTTASGTTAASDMPFKNIFNQDIGYGMEMMARMRNDVFTVAMETSLMDYFRERAIKIMGLRVETKSKFSPRWR